MGYIDNINGEIKEIEAKIKEINITNFPLRL